MVASEQQEPCCPRYSLTSHGTAILTSLVVCGSRGITNFQYCYFCGKQGERYDFNQLTVVGVEGQMPAEESVVNAGPLN